MYSIYYDGVCEFSNIPSLNDAVLWADQELYRTIIPRYFYAVIKDSNGVPIMEKKWIGEEPFDDDKWLANLEEYKKNPYPIYSDWIKLQDCQITHNEQKDEARHGAGFKGLLKRYFG